MGRFRALAITTLLLGGTAMLPSAADAAVILSRAGVSYTGTGGVPVAGTTVLVGGTISPWAPNDTLAPGAKWVSYNANTHPGASVVPSNGSLMSITESFSLANKSDLRIKALADDTAQVYVNNTLVWDFDTGPNSTCQSGIIGCLSQYAFDSAVTATAAVLAAANVGGNTVTIVTKQTQGDAFGTQYAIYTPIPGAALLFGSALAGLAWVRRRGQKAEAPLAA